MTPVYCKLSGGSGQWHNTSLNSINRSLSHSCMQFAMLSSHSVFQGIQFPSISTSTDMNNEKEKFYQMNKLD